MIAADGNGDRAAVLRDLRKRLALSQSGMGARLGIEAETISAYERGKRSISDPVWKLMQIELTLAG